jgi:ketosteroid isomerase-like protein
VNPAQSAQDEVLLIQRRFWEALSAKDAAALHAIISATFVGRSPGEPDQTREEFIATLTKFPVAVSEIAGEAIEVHVFGDVAILTGTQVARLQFPDGNAKSSHVMLSNVFRRENGIWQLALCHAFEIVQDI